ncbi:GntR family transcriptional regulator [Streptomyces rugosispiralis]|uniref:GntR family transcriptional regulator n=1 Tax=Streptomyces rugosispiralis TaxID=2967341 RepID=A0ABT1USN4_9ACTN|nr:GntR family transcriptional regulator [Streptomyces rugosispiralis]MCQ8188119.1 GntR family transcriptional regulator [Streptomyces rugosispiralis]
MPSRNRYTEIAEVLAAEIADQPTDVRVASEHEIAARFGVSRAAARSALQELEGRYLVRRVRGAGTFVNRPLDYVLSQSRVPSMHQTIREAGGVPRTVVRDVTTVPATGAIAERLEREEGSAVHLLVRQSYIDGLLSGWSQEWIPIDMLPELDAAVHAVESLDSILRQMCGVTPVRSWCRVSSVLPDRQVAEGLETAHNRPVWLVESLSRDAASGRAVMCSSSWSRPDSIRIIVELDGPADAP